MSRAPLRALHVAAGNLYGGVETMLATLARTDGPGLVHEFALCFPGRLADELAASGAPLHALGGARFSRPWTVWSARKRLGRLLRGRAVDVLISHGCWAHLLAAPAARKTGVPVAFWMHDRIAPGLPHWVDRRASELAPDRVVVNSFNTAEGLPGLFPGARSEVIRYPVAPPAAIDRAEARAAVRAEIGTRDEDVVIVIAARLERWKGQTLLLEALGRLREKVGWTAWIAGGAQRPHEAAYLEELKRQGEALRISGRVRFLGQRRDVPRLLAAADVHCQPNTGPEPFGITYVEALYAGLPVVSTRIGGAVEVVTEACGRLVPPDDAGALAEALAGLIDDPAERCRLGSAGPSRAAELCGPETVLPRLERCLRDAAGRSD